MSSLLSAPWFLWAVGIAIGLPILLIVLTEWQQTLRRRNSPLLRPVTVLRNFLVPLAALLMVMIGATQIPATATPVRIVGTLVAVVVLILMLSGLKASLFQGASESSWRSRIPSIFVDVVRLVLIVVGIGLIFAYIWGANIGGLFTALGIGSIVIGLTLQNSVGQIISGLLMLFEQPFKIGDQIETPTGKGRVVELNWRAVHITDGSGLRIIPNSVLAGESFINLSRPAQARTLSLTIPFGSADRPDRVCAVMEHVAAQLPQCRPDAAPKADPLGSMMARPETAMKYNIDIPLQSANDDWRAKVTFHRWLWYAARRAGLHLNEAEDDFSDPVLLDDALRNVVAPVLRLTGDQVSEMAAQTSVERYGAGEMILAGGVVPEAVSFIITGTAIFTADAEDGSRTEAGTLEEGSFLGQSTLIRNPAAGSYFAVDEVTLIRVEREAIERVVHHNPLLLQEFGRAIDERRAAVVRVTAEDDSD
ncbi:MAG: mechanosensitive ion channel family protein [Mycobacterium sp.]